MMNDDPMRDDHGGEQPNALLSDAQRAELNRRVADAAARPEDAVDWEAAYERTRRRLSP